MSTGSLSNLIKVYQDKNVTSPTIAPYKGGSLKKNYKLRGKDGSFIIGQEFDAAAFYCPYIPLTVSGVIADPNLYKNVTKFATRYGIAGKT